MIIRFKTFLYIVVLGVFSWMGWNSYSYLFSKETPQFDLKGIVENMNCKGDIDCILKGHDEYKIDYVTILLDGKPITDKQKINSSRFEYPFTVNTKELSNGDHTLKLEVQNSTYNKAKNKKRINFSVDNLDPKIDNLIVNNKVLQGRTLHIKFCINKELNKANICTLSKEFKCIKDKNFRSKLCYECFIPIDCEEEPKEHVGTIKLKDKVDNELNLDFKFFVEKCNFKRKSISLNPEKVKAENKAGLPEKRFELDIKELNSKSPQEKLWSGVFYTPIEIKDRNQISTDFGVIRTSQQKGLYQHKAIDVCYTPKSVIWAPQSGTVVLKNRYAHSGNTIVIDHGCNVLSLFFHLDSFAPIEVGDEIKKGNPIGTIGKTGYATGFHLHWEMRLDNIAVDPLQWTKQDF